MTHTAIIGIDPGLTGAIAVIADNRYAGAYDMPRARRRSNGEQVNAHMLAGLLRDIAAEHRGAYLHVFVEEVASRPGQGVASMFKFGESTGVVRGVVACGGWPCTWVAPKVWKRDCALSGTAKDASLARAVELFPDAEPDMRRKRDVGRADALLIARWGWRHHVGDVRDAA